MVRYFLQDTPLAGLERMMMQTPRPAAGDDSDRKKPRQAKAQRNERSDCIREAFKPKENMTMGGQTQ